MVEHFDRKSSIDRNALKKELMGSEAGIQDRALEIPEPFGQLILRVCRFECLRHSGDDLCLCQVVQKETAFVLRGNPQRGPLQRYTVLRAMKLTSHVTVQIPRVVSRS